MRLPRPSWLLEFQPLWMLFEIRPRKPLQKEEQPLTLRAASNHVRCWKPCALYSCTSVEMISHQKLELNEVGPEEVVQQKPVSNMSALLGSTANKILVGAAVNQTWVDHQVRITGPGAQIVLTVSLKVAHCMKLWD